MNTLAGYGSSSRYKKKRGFNILKHMFLWFVNITLLFVLFLLVFEREIFKLKPFEMISWMKDDFLMLVFSLFSAFERWMLLLLPYVFLSLLVVIGSVFFIKFLPYKTYSVDTKHGFIIQKKFFLPYYRGLVFVTCSNLFSQPKTTQSSANKNLSFYYDLLRITDFGIFISKVNAVPLIFIVVGDRAVTAKSLEKKLLEKRRIVVTLTNVDPYFEKETDLETIATIFFKNSRSYSLILEKSRILQNFTNRFILIMCRLIENLSVFIYVGKASEGSKNALHVIYLTNNKTRSRNLTKLFGLKVKKNKFLSFKENKVIDIILDNYGITSFSVNYTPKEIVNMLSISSIQERHPFYYFKPQSSKKANVLKLKKQILLGNKVFSNGDLGPPVSIPIDDLLMNMEIIGMIGRGKTRFVISILRQLINEKIGTLVFDIKGEYAKVFAEDPNVEIYTIGPPRPLCVNLFDTHDEDDVHNTLLIINEMLTTANLPLSPAMKNLFENALFVTHQSKDKNLLTFINTLYNQVHNIEKQKLKKEYIAQTLEAVLNRLNYIFNPINFEVLGGTKTTLNLSILDKGRTIILDLSKFQKKAARPSDIFLICNLILKLFYRHASTTGSSHKLKYVVILEEAINVIPNFYHLESSASLITAENNFLLGRSLGIGHITITQMWESVSNIVHGNSSTKIVFRSHENIEQISKALNLSDEEKVFVKQLPTQYCYVISEKTNKAILVKTLDQKIPNINDEQYLQLLKNRYPLTEYPLLFKNFVELRKSLNKLLSDAYSIELKRLKSKSNNSAVSNGYFSDKCVTKEEQEPFIFNDFLFKESPDVSLKKKYCEKLCSKVYNKKDCLKTSLTVSIIRNDAFKSLNKVSIEQIFKEPSTFFRAIKPSLDDKKLKFNTETTLCLLIDYLLMLKRKGTVNDLEIKKILSKCGLSNENLVCRD